MLAGNPTFWRGTTVPAFPVELKPQWRGQVAGLWLLNQPGAALDLSGNNNIGTPVGGPTLAGTAMGPATAFNGTSTIINTAKQFVNPQVFTLGVWFSTTVASGHKIIGFENAQTGTTAISYDRAFYVGTDGKLYFWIYNGGNKYAISTTTVTDGIPHFALAISSGSAVTVYLDNVLIGTISFSPVVYNGWWRIGGYRAAGTLNGSDGYFSGNILSAFVLSSALATSQDPSLYAAPFSTLLQPTERRLYYASTTADLIVSPGAGNVLFSGQAPGADAAVAPGAGNIALAGAAPSPDSTVAPGAGSIALNGYAPSANATARPGVGSIVLRGYAPMISGLDLVVYPGPGAIVLSGYAPTIVIPPLYTNQGDIIAVSGIATDNAAPATQSIMTVPFDPNRARAFGANLFIGAGTDISNYTDINVALTGPTGAVTHLLGIAGNVTVPTGIGFLLGNQYAIAAVPPLLLAPGQWTVTMTCSNGAGASFTTPAASFYVGTPPPPPPLFSQKWPPIVGP